MSYSNPENALKRSLELRDEGDVIGALEELHQALHGKKFKGNNIILERIMLEMIDLCSEKLTTQYLKEDIGHFRNVCQHTNMSLLENVLKTLKHKTDEIFKKVEEAEGIEKLTQILSQDSAQNLAFQQGDGDLNPDDLIFMANCQYTEVLEKNRIMPSVNFFIDVCKIILDTLRQNSKMLDFYNQTAQKCFEMCAKYNYKSEYQKVSETLHSHFNQILKQSKHPELLVQSKIPFPVKLDEEDALQKVLELRYNQLKIALKMRVWSDAFKTSENIYQLINRQKHHASRMKQILADFFKNLSLIFWESDFHLFHAYSLMNLQQIIKLSKTLTDDQKQQMNTQFVLATLSIPLNNKLSNFERLSVQYMPQGMNEFYDETSQIKNEIFSIASMLQVKGIPSRTSLINYLKIKNLHLSQECPQIQELFKLIENEESPFNIAKRGKQVLAELLANDTSNLGQYKDFIIKNLQVRILQKCKNYFKNLKMKSLQSLLIETDSFDKVEKLLYECNRENLVQTIIDHQTQSITFNQEVEVAQNLQKFGLKLKDAFQKVQAQMSQGSERERIFLKVKEKMEQEMGEVLKRKDDMIRIKEDIKRTMQEENKSLQDIFSQQQREREILFAQQQVKEEKERQKNKLLDELELMRKMRAQEVLQELTRRGIKKINGVKISEMEKKEGENMDYDSVMNFYQNLLKKEKDQFESEKQKKVKEIEYWARAVREEEKNTIEKYCQQNGEEEVKQIQKAIADRHQKEMEMKKSIEKAYPIYQIFKETVMRQRRADHQKKVADFVYSKGVELQAKILEEANRELKKVENLRLVQQRQETLRKRDLQLKAAGIGSAADGDDGANDGWQKNTSRPDARPDRPPREQREPETTMSRTGFGEKKAEERPAGTAASTGTGRPQFKKQEPRRDEDSGFIGRGAMGQAAATVPKEEEKTTAPKRTFGGDSQPSSTSGPWRSTGAQASAAGSNQQREAPKSGGGFTKPGQGAPTRTMGQSSTQQSKPQEKKEEGGWRVTKKQ